MKPDALHPNTLVVRAGVGQDVPYGSVSMPIYQSVTYQHPGDRLGPYDYSRTDNPTRKTLAQALTALEGGAGAALFSSGMAAITTLFQFLSQGDHVVLTEDLYGGTYRVLVDVFHRHGIAFDFVDTRDPDQVRRAMTDRTRLVFIESPSNPLLKITDIRRMAQIAHDQGAWLAVDNTFMTPLRQRPLDLGADWVVYSVTKYLAGHNDVVAGALVARRPDHAEALYQMANTTGGVLGPFDAWLTLRGLKTLAVRLDRQEQNAQGIARFLSEHPRVRRVHYPGLPAHPGYQLQQAQARGAGAMISFELPSVDSVPRFMDALRVIIPAVSLGGTESLITHPFSETHREFPEERRRRLGIMPGLMRLSVGLEYLDDLLADLDQALNAL